MVSVRSLFPISVLMRKFHFGVTEWNFLVLFIMTESSLIVHQEIIQDIIHQELTWKNTWLFVSDKIKIKQMKLQCSSSDISVPYILIYRK